MIIELPQGYSISTDRHRMNVTVIHEFLSREAYWCLGIPLATVQKAVDNSLNFGLFYHAEQVGYARIISDLATIAYLGDVFILPAHRNKGLSKCLVKAVMDHPDLQGLRRWILLTQDAHEIYSKLGWTPIAHPEKWMEIHAKNVYQQETAG